MGRAIAKSKPKSYEIANVVPHRANVSNVTNQFREPICETGIKIFPAGLPGKPIQHSRHVFAGSTEMLRISEFVRLAKRRWLQLELKPRLHLAFGGEDRRILR